MKYLFYRFIKNKVAKSVFLFSTLCLLFLACNQQSTVNHSDPDDSFVRYNPQYAKGFYAEIFDHYKKIYVIDPWDTSRFLAKYFVASSSDMMPKNKGFTFVSNEIQPMACLFAPDVASAYQLGLIDQIKAVSSKEYFHNPKLHQNINLGKTVDVGPSENFDSEKLLASGTKICFVSPFKENKYQKIQESGIVLAISAGYMENHPLARAEWIKFMALFYNLENYADSLFNEISNDYNNTLEMLGKVDEKPRVLGAKMYQDVWFVSGGESYISQLFKDAGAEYVWSDLKFSGSEPYDFETVFHRAHNADFWVFQEYFKGDYTYKKLKSENLKYSYFDAFKNQSIIYCNTHSTSYYEDGVMEPHIVLKDLVKLFHPSLNLNHQNVYFKPLTN